MKLLCVILVMCDYDPISNIKYNEIYVNGCICEN